MAKGIKIAVDWLSITIHPQEHVPVDVDQVQLATSLAIGCDVADWVDSETGSYGYHKGMFGPGGARIWWDAPGRIDIHVSLPGVACQAAGEDRLRSFLRFCLEHGGKPSRLDVNLDDYDRVIEPDQFRREIQGANVVTHAHRWLVQHGGTVGTAELTGITAYLGAPSSRQRLRVYDKSLESGGELDCVRWELQSRDEAAHSLADRLQNGVWSTVIRSRLITYVDFRDAESHSEIEKRVRLPWWERLIAGVKKAKAYPPQAVRTIDQVIEYVDQAIGPSLAMLVASAGGDLTRLLGIIERGRLRWKPRHHAILAGA